MTISISRYFPVALLFICINSFAQSPAIEWHKCLGSNFSDYVRSIQPTTDGGFIVSGTSTGLENGDVSGHHGNYTVGDLWIVKLDKSGTIEWQKSLGGTDSEEGGIILPTADGGYILAGGAASRGCSLSENHGGMDFWIVKLNSKGDVTWQKMYGGSNIEAATSVALSNDGGYFVSGYTLSNDGDITASHGSMDYWVIKIDASGKLIWQKSLGGTEYDFAESIQATNDGGCIVAGSSASVNGDVTGNHGSNDYWVVKLDNSGKIQWQKALGGTMTELAKSILVNSDGSYIVAGMANSYDGDVTGVHGEYDAWIVKLSADGKIIWQKTYGGTKGESVNYVKNTPDGGYVFTGASMSSDGDFTCNAGFDDVIVMKINSSGILEWKKAMGGKDNDEGFSVQPLSDGSFILAARTSSSDIAGYHSPFGGGIYDDIYDYWVVKLSASLSSTPTPVVKIDPATAIVCSGKKATIRASVLFGGVNPQFQWTKNGVPVGTNSALYTDNFNANDNVSCLVKLGNKCEDGSLKGSDAIVIKLKNTAQDPQINISTDNPYACDCAEITFNAKVSNGGGSPNYQWLVNGVNAGINSPVLISHKLKDGDVVTCIYSDNFTCAGNGTVLSNEIKIGGPNPNPPSVSVTVSADTICKGSIVTFTAKTTNAGSNPIYQWKINNSNVGTNNPVFSSSSITDGAVITCSIKTDPLFTCASGTAANSNNIVMHVLDKLAPSIKISASAETICTGSNATFIATATGAGINPTYQWKINGVNTGANDKVYSNSSLKDGDKISCTITIDPQYTCALTNQATSPDIIMKVSAGTVPSVEITADKNNVCTGENITLTAIAKNAGTSPVYQWFLNDVVLTNNSAVFSSNRLANGDRLFCRIIPGIGACSSVPDSSNLIVASLKPLPVVHISPADTTIKSGTQLQLKSSMTGNVVSFKWTAEDKLINPQSLNPQTNVLDENTNYKLTVTDDKGCTGFATAIVRIGTSLFMPNAFTPNHDGINDVFRIPPNAIIDLKEFTIYDRWGNKIFTTTNKNVGWDGTLKGKKQKTSTYVYYIKCSINNKETFLKGHFTLIN